MKNIIYFLLLVVIITVQSCSPTYYASSANVGLFTEKNQFKGGLGISQNTANLDLSYSISDDFLVTANANGFITQETTVLSTTYKGSKGYSFNIAPGYYKVFGNYGVFETLLGYGYNYTDSHHAEGNFHKAFIQPTIGLSQDYIELAFTPRFTTTFIDKNTFLDKRSSQINMFIEPIATVRAGSKNLKVTTQLGFSIPTANTNFNIQPAFWNFGIQYHFRNQRAQNRIITPAF